MASVVGNGRWTRVSDRLGWRGGLWRGDILLGWGRRVPYILLPLSHRTDLPHLPKQLLLWLLPNHPKLLPNRSLLAHKRPILSTLLHLNLPLHRLYLCPHELALPLEHPLLPYTR